ncbi:hypothetical protein [Borrelia coriaceae]|uniref:Uncharacterized protein n=1 Tax=Borrelia coriaceae ATCC 43381 TaxID=1408429 RepID=W5SXW1_9SPIR|nr:hypothetical protein [Borrelia coriaceae]AHH11717.1 Hypothetical protein BCO_0122001 [Borrelia coriaceae ATCC 43381]
MKRIEHIKLYKVGEAVDILYADFNHQTTSPVLCRKITMLKAYIMYNDVRYIPEDIIGDLIVSIRKKEIRFKTEKIIAKKLESIKNFIKAYEQKHKKPPTKETNNINTNEILEAITQLKEEMKKMREQEQKELKEKNMEIIQLKEELKEKNTEITQLKEMMQKMTQTKFMHIHKSHSNTCNTKNI